MPKFKAGDEVLFASEEPATIERVIEVNAMWFYVYITHDGAVKIQAAAYFDLYAKPYTKYVKGDIWLSADKSKAFIVESETHMSRLFERENFSSGEGRTGYDRISRYEELYGPLVKWERTYHG